MRFRSRTAAAFKAAKARPGGATTVLNPAPASKIDPALLAVTDWLIPNESEFELITGSPPTDVAIKKFAADVGVRVLVTLGADGVALVIGPGEVERFPPPALSEPVLDTTGAGDAFVGAFAHSLATDLIATGKYDEEAAASLGMACASDSVTREGTQTAFPDRDLCEMIAAGIASSRDYVFVYTDISIRRVPRHNVFCWISARQANITGIITGIPCLRSIPLVTLTPCCAARRRIIRPPSEPMHEVSRRSSSRR